MRLKEIIVLAVALIVSSFFIRQGLQRFNRNERTISVRGLAEKEVSSNTAVWKIHYNVSSGKLEDVRKNLPEVQNTIFEFLKGQKFDESEIVKGSRIVDRQAQDYGAEKGNRFVANGYFVITTKNVEQVALSEQKIDDLLKKGLVITSNQVDYYFTDLNQIKPAMLDEATQNAKEAANGFAKSMDVNVGKLKSASQGVFSIENPIGDDSGFDQEKRSSLKKKVRVVTQVEFYIN